MIIKFRPYYYLLYIDNEDSDEYGMVFSYDTSKWQFVHNTINGHIGVAYLTPERKAKFDYMFNDYITSLRDGKIDNIIDEG